MPRLVFPTLILILAGCTGGREDVIVKQQATINGQHLISSGFPQSTITFDSTLTYVGSETFILYDVARCEIHLFAEADESKQVNRLYWIQYEGYLDSPIPRRYDYSNDPFRAEIDGAEFFESVNYYDVALSRPEWKDDSDIEHVFRLLDREGYHFDKDVMRVRLVHLDQTRESELMIMYMEAMDGRGLSIAELDAAGGKESVLWAEASMELRNRALSGMELSFD